MPKKQRKWGPTGHALIMAPGFKEFVGAVQYIGVLLFVWSSAAVLQDYYSSIWFSVESNLRI